MKIFTFLIVVFFLQSCTSDSNSNGQNSCINPPNWLHGTWVRYDNNEPDIIIDQLIITSDNIVSSDYSSSSNYREIYCGKEPNLTTSEIFENHYYAFSWSVHIGGETTELKGYYLKQPQSNKMMYNNYLNDEGIIYTKL